MTKRFTTDDRIRVDIPDGTGSNHKQYHGWHGAIITVIKDDAPTEAGDERDDVI